MQPQEGGIFRSKPFTSLTTLLTQISVFCSYPCSSIRKGFSANGDSEKKTNDLLEYGRFFSCLSFINRHGSRDLLKVHLQETFYTCLFFSKKFTQHGPTIYTRNLSITFAKSILLTVSKFVSANLVKYSRYFWLILDLIDPFMIIVSKCPSFERHQRCFSLPVLWLIFIFRTLSQCEIRLHGSLVNVE